MLIAEIAEAEKLCPQEVFRDDSAMGANPGLWPAIAILDRLLHLSQVVTIRGDSYRRRDKRRSGLLPKAATATPITATE